MRKFIPAISLILAAAALPACHKKPVPPPPPVIGSLGVDLYLHPESASADDLILQTAIRGKLESDPLTRGRVQVRVSSLKVFLAGSVVAQSTKDNTTKLAAGTTVAIGDKSSNQAPRVITASAVDDSQLTVGPGFSHNAP